MLLVNRLVGGLVVVSMLLISVPVAEASTLQERMAERRAEREARMEERRAALRERLAEIFGDDEEETTEEETPAVMDDTSSNDVDEPECRCSARLGFSRPQLLFSNGTLTFKPRVDIRIRSRGDFEAPGWETTLAHSGSTEYMSEDVPVPDGVTFNGTQSVFRGSCGTDYTYKGYDLPAVPLNGLVQGLLGIDDELEGTVKMHAEISGCGFDSEHRQFPFEWKDLLNVRTRGWRTVR